MTALSFSWEALAGSWDSLTESAPYLLFGFLMAGLVHGFVSDEAVGRHLGSGKASSVLKAALFGIPLPLCSCGVIPAALNLRRKGASRGAVVSFLVSTPETGVDSIALSWGLLGPVLTVFRPLAAFATAVAAGLSENLFGAGESPGRSPEVVCGCRALPRAGRPGTRVREGLRFAFGDLLGDLAPWLAVGFLVAGVISAAVPPAFLERHLGAGPLSYVAMLAVGMPLYICATASTPIAAALLAKGLSPGAALVFLLAGPATNASTITALSGLLGPWSTARYVLAIGLAALGMGALLDLLARGLSLPAQHLALGTGELFPPAVGVGSALLLAALAFRTHLPSRRPAPQACSGAT